MNPGSLTTIYFYYIDYFNMIPRFDIHIPNPQNYIHKQTRLGWVENNIPKQVLKQVEIYLNIINSSIFVLIDILTLTPYFEIFMIISWDKKEEELDDFIEKSKSNTSLFLY